MLVIIQIPSRIKIYYVNSIINLIKYFLLFAQLYSNSMVTAGLINDSRKLVSNMNRLLQLVVEKY